MRLTNPSLKTDNVILADVNTAGAQLIKLTQAMRGTDEARANRIAPQAGGPVLDGDGPGKHMTRTFGGAVKDLLLGTDNS